MVRAESPLHAIEHAMTLCEVICARVDWPQLSTEIAYGTAARRDEDYFGATVNRAARLCAHAQAGEVLVDQALREAVVEHEGIVWEPRGEVVLRNLSEAVRTHRATRRHAAAPRTMRIDPLCRMQIDPDAAVRITLDGRDYAFCSSEYAARFRSSPGAFKIS